MTEGIRRAAGGISSASACVVAALTVVAAVLFSVLLTTATAFAHGSLIASSPADGQRLQQGPRLVTLTFDDDIRDDGMNQVAVTGPDGTQWTDGRVRVAGAVVTTTVRGWGPAGEYTIGYRVVSADGDPVAGEVTFTLVSAGSGAPVVQSPLDPAPSNGGSSGLPLSAWLAGALGVLGIGLTLTVQAARRGDGAA